MTVLTQRVTVIGDSLSHHATRFFPTEWVIKAQVGRALYQSMSLVEGVRNRDVVVLALGSNDVNDRRGSVAMRRTFRMALDNLSHVPTVVITDVKVKGVNPIYGTYWRSYATQWNLIVAEFNGVHVAPWDDLATKHPGWFVADGLHMNNTGQKAYANFLKNRVRIATQNLTPAP